MKTFGMAACGPQDLAANTSARAPRPAALRTLGSSRCCSLPVRAVRFHKHRPTVVAVNADLGQQQQQRSQQQQQPTAGPRRATTAAAAAAAAAGSAGATSSNPSSVAPRAVLADGAAAVEREALVHGTPAPQPPMSVGTAAVHGGELGTRARQGVADALTTPIVCTSTYTFRNTAELIAYQDGSFKSFEYGRYGNPTTRAAEEKIMALEGAEDCLLSGSGMCSATTMLLALVPAGGHIVTTTDCYRRTRQFIQTMLPKMGIGCTVIDPSDLNALAAALERHNVSLFFSESPTNPYLRCVDVPAVSRLCRAAGAVVCIDSTFATPVNQRALALGADLVIHSATKYLAGHNDVLAGAIAGRADLVESVRHLHNILGGVIDPHASYLVLRGMKTLRLRVEAQNKAALEIARRLEAHPKIARVHYPGLESHPDYKVAAAQMDGYGGVVSFEVDGDLWRAAAFIDAVRIPRIAPSLGGVESLIEQPTVISYWDQGPDKRAEIGIKDSLVRFSVGIEDVEDLWADLEQALASV